jgi:hypothetical protein
MATTQFDKIYYGLSSEVGSKETSLDLTSYTDDACQNFGLQQVEWPGKAKRMIQ